MKYRMKMLRKDFEKMKLNLIGDVSVEQGCFLLCSNGRTPDGVTLLVKDMISLSRSDFAIQKSDFLSVTPETMLRVTRKAQKTGTAVCMAHTHPMSNGPTNFSMADDIGNERSFRFFNRMLPEMPNSCLVWNRDMSHVSGRVYETANQWAQIQPIEIIDDPVSIKQDRTTIGQDDELTTTYNRQALLLGKVGQSLLHDRKIAVIGLGGIGSVVAGLLAHSGIGHLVLVDDDCFDRTNRPRILGSTRDDVSNETPKVEISERYIGRATPECRVTTFQCAVEYPAIMQTLTGMDAIVCCTDSTTSRAFLNQLCNQYYIPVMDLGVQFVVRDGIIRNEIGKVNFTLPDKPCLACTGFVHPDILREESLSPDERQKLHQDGYLRGSEVKEPSMMMFNAEVASRGVQKLVGHFTGLIQCHNDVYERFSFLGLNGRPHCKLVKKRKQDDCLICGESSIFKGAGDIYQPLIGSVEAREKVCL